MNELITDEYINEKKPRLKFIVFCLIFLILFGGIILFCVWFFSNRSTRDKLLKSDIVLKLNPELNNTYIFAVDNDNYIVSIKKDGSVVKIYNLLQGTETFGEFRNFTYFDKKLYLMFSNNIIYTISLIDGDRSYQLKKLFEYSPLSCNGQVLASNDISIHKDFIYFNNSNCGVNMYDMSDNRNASRLNSIKNFSSFGVYLAYNKYTSSLYFYSVIDSKIYQFNEKTADVSVLIDNVKTDRDIDIVSDVLVYTQKNNDSTYDYYGYSLKGNDSILMVRNVLGLIKYGNGFIYYTKDKVVYLTNDKKQVIYKSDYGVLSDFELIGSSNLQIVDSSADGKKNKIVNIDLNNKNKRTIVSNKYKYVRFLDDIEKYGVSN